ncbi:MAG: hypothetical protein ACMXYE_00155 [Candidatus Woesearchaeota archaeon]
MKEHPYLKVLTEQRFVDFITPYQKGYDSLRRPIGFKEQNWRQPAGIEKTWQIVHGGRGHEYGTIDDLMHGECKVRVVSLWGQAESKKSGPTDYEMLIVHIPDPNELNGCDFPLHSCPATIKITAELNPENGSLIGVWRKDNIHAYGISTDTDIEKFVPSDLFLQDEYQGARISRVPRRTKRERFTHRFRIKLGNPRNFVPRNYFV